MSIVSQHRVYMWKFSFFHQFDALWGGGLGKAVVSITSSSSLTLSRINKVQKKRKENLIYISILPSFVLWSPITEWRVNKPPPESTMAAARQYYHMGGPPRPRT